MTLLHPLVLLPAAAALAAYLLLRGRRGAGDWSRVLSPGVMRHLSAASGGRGRRNPALLALALVLVALSSPAMRGPGGEAYMPDEGVLVVADLSRSMTLTDVSPSRLSALKSVARGIADAAGARPLGLIVYAGDAYVAQPFSRDRGQYASFVAALAHGTVAEEGSDVGRALALASSVVRQSGLAHARVVLVGDGGGIDAAATDLARQMKGRGARVDVVLTALADTAAPGAVDMSAVTSLAHAGAGTVAAATRIGAVDLVRLDLAGDPVGGVYALLATEAMRWRNLSHYLLLCALPLLLLLFRRGAA
jgi:Ca-activated chloride channel family protein